MDLRRTLLFHSWLQVVLWVALALVVNHVASAWFVRVDLTADQKYTLSPEAGPILDELDRPLLARVYFTEGLKNPFHNHKQAVIEKLQELRAYAGGQMEIQVIDPGGDKDLIEEAKSYGVEPIQYRFRARDQYEEKWVFMGVALLYGDEQRAVSPLDSMELLEYELVRAIHALVTPREDRKVVAYLQGNAEPDLARFPDEHPIGRLRHELDERYDLRKVVLGADEGVPDDVDALLVIGPEAPVSDRTQYQIDQFLMNGGAVAFMVSSIRPDNQRPGRARPASHNLHQLLGSYGVRLNKDTVLDRKNNQPIELSRGQKVSYPLFLKSSRYNEGSPITRRLEPATAPFVSSLELADPLPALVEATVLLSSEDTSSRVESLQFIQPQNFTQRSPGEEDGSFPLAVALSGNFTSFFADRPVPPLPGVEEGMASAQTDATDKLIDGAPARLVVVGSQDFIANNVGFVLNAIDWMVQDITLVNIRSKASTVDLLPVPSRTEAAVWKAYILGIPLGILALLGGFVWVTTRRRG